MSKLQAFLKPTINQETKEVVVSTRFQDEKGNPVPFVVRAIPQEENDRLIKRSTKREKLSGQTSETLDKIAYNKRLVVACVQEPDFCAKEMCDAYGVVDPMDVPGKMLYSGEYAKLLQAIMEINGFEDADTLADEAKNS